MPEWNNTEAPTAWPEAVDFSEPSPTYITMYHVALKGNSLSSTPYRQTIQLESEWRKDKWDSGEGSFSSHEIAEFELVSTLDIGY